MTEDKGKGARIGFVAAVDGDAPNVLFRLVWRDIVTHFPRVAAVTGNVEALISKGVLAGEAKQLVHCRVTAGTRSQWGWQAARLIALRPVGGAVTFVFPVFADHIDT